MNYASWVDPVALFRAKVALRKTPLFWRERGTRYECTLCGTALRRLKPGGSHLEVLSRLQVIGGGYRENAICPICGSMDRERLVQRFLELEVAPIRGRILHVSPEPGLGAWLRRQPSVVHIPGDKHPRYRMQAFDIENLPFSDGSIDGIVCNHVLEHVDDDQKAMAELYRVLMPGGWAVLQVPFSLVLEGTAEDASISSDADREENYGQRDHVRLYGRDYPDRLRAAGFTVKMHRWWEAGAAYGAPENRYGLQLGEILFSAVRPE